jgi:acetoin utilization protein AcuB
MDRPLAVRIKYGFWRTHKLVLDDAPWGYALVNGKSSAGMPALSGAGDKGSGQSPIEGVYGVVIVRMWMQQDVVTVGPEMPAMEAAALMARRQIRRLPVIQQHSDGPHLIGMVSARDILHAFPPDVNPFAVITPETPRNAVTVGDIMSRHLVTTTPETPIEQAAAAMRERKIGALPVLRRQRLAGLITESDIFRAFVSFLASGGEGVRVTFDMSKGEDVFGFIAATARERKVNVVNLISSHQDNRPICVVRLTGGAIDDFLDDLWSSHHTVLNVIRFSEALR